MINPLSVSMRLTLSLYDYLQTALAVWNILTQPNFNVQSGIEKVSRDYFKN